MVSSLPSKKRGRPLLLGDELDKQVHSYARATTVSTSIHVVAILIAKHQLDALTFMTHTYFSHLGHQSIVCTCSDSN